MDIQLARIVIIKQIIIYIALFFSIQVYSQLVDRERYVNLDLKEQPLSIVLDKIRNQTGFNFIYCDELIENIKVSFLAKGLTVDEIVKRILKDSGISYKKYGENSIVLYRKDKPKQTSYIATLEEQIVLDTNTNYIISRPEIISNNIPFYPPEAEKNNIGGRVDAKLLITKEGDVIECEIESSSGFEILDSAAAEFAFTLKFTPARANDKPVKIWITMVFEYKILNNK